jgi:hypothetical protein
MALRKFIFFNASEGFSEEQTSTDELSLGKVTAVGVGGIAFDASSQRIVGVATPTAGTDAVNRDYVQAYAAGLDWKASARLATAAALPAVTASGSGVGKTLTANSSGPLLIDGFPVAVGNRVLIKDQAAGVNNGIYTVTTLGVGALAATGSITAVAGSALVDGETFTISDGVNTPVVFEFDSGGGVSGANVAVAFTGGDSATTVATAIAAAINGALNLYITASPSGAVVSLTNDYVGTTGNVAISETVADGGFTVSGMSAGADGVWVLTRATDADANAEVTASLAVFVEEGTISADTGWTLTTNDPIVVDTTALTFTQFTGTGGIVAGAGISKTGSQIDVELDTAAGAQTTGSGGGTSGLEFDISGAAGKLRAKVDPAGGIQRLSAGLALELDNTPSTLSVGAAGLKVVGLPSLFLINGSAVSANVTAANLDTLTAGADSAGDALHFHSNHVQIWTTSANVDLGDGVYISGNNTVAPGEPSVDAQARAIGVARETVTSPNPVEIVVSGVVAGALSGATANVPYYLGAGGAPVLYGTLGGNARIIRLGFAKNATDLEVRIHDYGKKI